MESGEPDTTVEDSTAEVSKQRWTVRWNLDSHIPPINNIYYLKGEISL